MLSAGECVVCLLPVPPQIMGCGDSCWPRLVPAGWDDGEREEGPAEGASPLGTGQHLPCIPAGAGPAVRTLEVRRGPTQLLTPIHTMAPLENTTFLVAGNLNYFFFLCNGL